MATLESISNSTDRRKATAAAAAQFASPRQGHRPGSPQQATSFFFRANEPSHANLRKHLPHFDAILPPPLLKRQNAILEDTQPDSGDGEDKFSISPMPMRPVGAPEKRRCRICFSETEEGANFISPCKCSGSIRYVHDICLEDWMASSTLPRECSTCNEPFSFYLNSGRPSHYQKVTTSRRRSILSTLAIVILTTFIIESYRCTEFQKISGSELEEDGDGSDGLFTDDQDFIWLPIIQHSCSRESLIATPVRFILNSSFYTIALFFTFIFLYHIPLSHRHQQ